MSNFIGSIDLTRIPKECFKKVTLKNGEVHIIVNVALWERKEPQTFGERIFTHLLSCAPKKEERKEGENYICGNFSEMRPKEPQIPTPEQIAAAPVASPNDFPF